MSERLSILGHYLAARRNFTRFRTREALESWQDARVRKHLRRVLEGSPYYREVHAGSPPEDWRALPVSNKASLMAAFDGWNTAGVTLAEALAVAERAEETRDFSRTIWGLAVGLSSGTTGSRGVFLVSPRERRRWAGTILARTLRGSLHREHRSALFLRADSPLYQTVGSRRFSFSFFDLFAPFEEHWPRLEALRPTLLAAPPAALVRLAAHPAARTLLAPPRLLLSVADVLDDADRALVEAGFGVKVGQLYQATEGFLAATCPEGRLHWNEDALVVEKEWLDAERTRYHPIVTDFRRTTQPILRFRLDDVILASEADGPRCPCGSVFETLEKIEGRQDDVLYLPKLGSGEPLAVFPDFVRRALILALPTGCDYTVAQTALSAWTVETSEPSANSRVVEEVALLCAGLGVHAPALSFAPWTAPHPGAKRRRVRRMMPPPRDQ